MHWRIENAFSLVTMWHCVHIWVLKLSFIFCLFVCFSGLMVFSRPSEDVALPDFFHSLFSVCVCICGHVCVLSVQVLRCTFTHFYTHAYCQNWLGLFVTLPTMTTSSNVKNFFVFWFLLSFIHVHWLSLWVSARCRNTRVLFVSCHRLGLQTLPRGALAH